MRQAVNQQMRINILRAGIAVLLPILLFIRPHMPVDGVGHEIIESAGILMVIAGVLGRFWSILYIGGVKNAEVMQHGPYSITRNPLYLSSTIAAFGVGLMLGAVSFALLLGGTVGLILYLTARREAGVLADHFGADYSSYARRVPFFLPDPRLFHSPSRMNFQTDTLRRNLFDAMVFLSFIPLVELIDGFKQHFGITGFTLW